MYRVHRRRRIRSHMVRTRRTWCDRIHPWHTNALLDPDCAPDARTPHHGGTKSILELFSQVLTMWTGAPRDVQSCRASRREWQDAPLLAASIYTCPYGRKHTSARATGRRALTVHGRSAFGGGNPFRIPAILVGRGPERRLCDTDGRIVGFGGSHLLGKRLSRCELVR